MRPDLQRQLVQHVVLQHKQLQLRHRLLSGGNGRRHQHELLARTNLLSGRRDRQLGLLDLTAAHIEILF